jgi:hypothetical protein
MAQGIQTKTIDHQNCDSYNYDDQEDEEDRLSTQLLIEYYADFTKTEAEAKDEDEDEPFVQIPTPDASSLAPKRRARGKKKKRSRKGD